MNPNEPIDIEDLYHVRMVILMESEPQSNRYNQIRFLPEQFIHVSDAIVECFERYKHEAGIPVDHTRYIKLPDDIQDYYEKTK